MLKIVLVSDWANDKLYLSAFKGQLLSLFDKDVEFLDIIKIPPYDYLKAIFIVRNTFKFYPRGVIFLILIESVDFNKSLLLIEKSGYFFILNNDGNIFLLFNEGFNVLNSYKKNESVFLDIELLSKILSDIKNNTFKTSQQKINLEQKIPVKPVLNKAKDKIISHIIYIDDFGNLFLDITRGYLERLGKFIKKIEFKGFYFKLYKNYGAIQPDELNYAIFDRFDYLKLGIRGNNLADLMNAKIFEEVNIYVE